MDGSEEDLGSAWDARSTSTDVGSDDGADGAASGAIEAGGAGVDAAAGATSGAAGFEQQLEQWGSPDHLDNDRTWVWCVVGTRSSGKTTLVRDLLHRLAGSVSAVILVGDRVEGDAITVQPLVHMRAWDDALVGFLRLWTCRQRARQQAQGVFAPDEHKPLLLVVDTNRADTLALARSEAFRELVRLGRHRGCRCIVTVDDVRDMPPGTRNNVDGFFWLSRADAAALQRQATHALGAPLPPAALSVLASSTSGEPKAVFGDRCGDGVVASRVDVVPHAPDDVVTLMPAVDAELLGLLRRLLEGEEA